MALFGPANTPTAPLQAQHVRDVVAATTSEYHFISGDILVPPRVDSANSVLACSTRLFPGDDVDSKLHTLTARLADLVPGLLLLPTKDQALELVGEKMLPYMEHLLATGAIQAKMPKLDLREILHHIRNADEAWRQQALLRLKSYGAAWVLGRLGVDYRQDTNIQVKAAHRRSLIVTADVRISEALRVATKNIVDRPAAAQIIIIDVPFGYNMHDGAAPSSTDWDKEHMTPQEVLSAIGGSVSLGLALPNHVVLLFCAKEMFGDMKRAFEAQEYSVHSVTFGKVDSTRYAPRS